MLNQLAQVLVEHWLKYVTMQRKVTLLDMPWKDILRQVCHHD